MKSILAISAFCVSVTFGAMAQQLPAYEMPRTQVASIASSQTDRQYELLIKLPEDYTQDTEKRYPVIYTTDAVWHMDMLSGAAEYLMPDAILVGVSWQTDLGLERPYDSRFRDYSVTPFSNPDIQAKYQGGKADEHLDFIRDDVVPFIDASYQTDPQQRTLFGYSMGGEFVAYTALAAPNIFKNYVIGSPDINQDAIEFLRQLDPVANFDQEKFDIRIFISIGELEDELMDGAKSLFSVLQNRIDDGYAITGLDIIEGADHAAAFPETTIRSVKWLRRIHDE